MQNILQLKALVTTAIAFVNFEPPLSIATKFRSHPKMIAMPAPTNQSVSVFMCNGKAKTDIHHSQKNDDVRYYLIRLCTTGFIHLYGWASYSAVATEYTAISLFRF